jgi:hypothetical protein
MPQLSDHLNDIARHYWSTWKTIFVDKGWSLGPDNGALKMSPYLVDDWDSLGPAGQEWFTQHAAIALHAIHLAVGPAPASAPPKVNREFTEKAIRKLRSARAAFKDHNPGRGSVKLKAAFTLLTKAKNEEARKVVRSAMIAANDFDEENDLPTITLSCITTALKLLNKGGKPS